MKPLTARKLAMEIFDLQIQFNRERERLDCLNNESVNRLAIINHCIVDTAVRLARAVLDETGEKKHAAE